MLKYAWYNRDDKAELKAYDALADVYFLLGRLDEASHYHERALKQKLEWTETSIRQMASNQITIRLHTLKK